MQIIRRATAFFFGFADVIIDQLGLSQTAFAISAKVVTEDVLKRCEQEIMEFGSSSVMFMIIPTLAMLNLLSLIGGLINTIFLDFGALQNLIPHIILCGLMILVNVPIYEALFRRRDNGCLPYMYQAHIEDVLKRYEQEIMEFGSSSVMFTIIATLAMLNLLSLIGGLINAIFLDFGALQNLICQIILCGLMILVNVPIYEALFLRRDKGCLPFSVMLKSVVFASLACLLSYK